MWKMDPSEILMSRASGGGGGNGGEIGEGFIDRSKVRILLCDNDSKSSEEVFILLCKCSYQVTSVRSPRQVIDALNAEGADIDIILSEVDLPMAKGLKMLKYVMRDKESRRIPVIMMSAQDEVSLVVKCLRLGAADYLVKPLRTNELLNLWTHMWRRRRMLGLAEKNIMNCEFDLLPSDPSDANTDSTTLFSDDTDEKLRKSSNPEMSLSICREDEINAAGAPGPVDTQIDSLSNDRRNSLGTNEQKRGQIMSAPKKSELKIGQSSAFFTYVKSSMFRSTILGGAVSVNGITPPLPRFDNRPSFRGREAASLTIDLTVEDAPEHLHIDKEVGQGHRENPCPADDFPSNGSFLDSTSVGRSCTPPKPAEGCQQMYSKTEAFAAEGQTQQSNVGQMQQSGNNSRPDIAGFHAYSAYPYYHHHPGVMMNHVMMSSASSMYQTHMNDMHHHANGAMVPQYNQYCPPHHMPGMTPFPYYPVCLPGQMHPWPSYRTSSSNDGKVQKVDRRTAALLKFRQKRKERCFDKKIRYVNRKKLAERRPRVKGQFVRKVNGINVDLNGQPTSTDFDDEEDDDEEEEDQDYAVFHG